MSGDSDLIAFTVTNRTEENMKFPSNKIEAAVSQEQSRYTINAVKLDVEQKKLIATDGHIMAVVPAEVSDRDHSGLIGLETIKMIRDMHKRQKFTPNVAVNGKVTIEGLNETATASLIEGSFPNWQAILPKFEGKPTISFDVNLLVRLADALRSEAGKKNGHKRVSLWIRSDSDVIVVRSIASEDSESIGVMMPVRA